MVKFLDPDADPDYHQNLVNWSLDYVKPFHKISQRFDQYFLSNRVNRQTDRQTYVITASLADVKIVSIQVR